MWQIIGRVKKWKIIRDAWVWVFMWGIGRDFDSEAKLSGPDIRLWKLLYEFWGGKKLISFCSMGHLVSTLNSNTFSLVMLTVLRQLWIFKTSLSNSYIAFQSGCVQLMTSPAQKRKKYFLHRLSTCLEAEKNGFLKCHTQESHLGCGGESLSRQTTIIVIFLAPSNNQPTKMTLFRNDFQRFSPHLE